jgi:hypothetical protein
MYIYRYHQVTQKTQPEPIMLAAYAELYEPMALLWPNGRSLPARIQAALAACQEDGGNLNMVLMLYMF